MVGSDEPRGPEKSDAYWLAFVDAHHVADFCEADDRVIEGLMLEGSDDPMARFCTIKWRGHVAFMERMGYRIHVTRNGRTTLRAVLP